MNWDALGAIGEVVGAVAVFGTLIYLALQIRIQNQQLQMQNKESRLAGNQELLRSIRETSTSLYSDPELMQIYGDSFSIDIGSLDSVSALRLSLVYQNQLRVWEGAFYQHLDKQVDERLWPSLERAMSSMLASAAFKQWWPTRASHFSDDFVKYVNSIKDPQPAVFWSQDESTPK